MDEMNESIINIDSCESFCEPTDESFEDVHKIVQQWKINDSNNSFTNSSSSAEKNRYDKYVDTRTFTRPKKKLNYPFVSSLFGSSSGGFDNYSSSSSKQQNSTVNLEIGGLVTNNNMQRSYLGDVSPPSSLCSSEYTNDRMDNSLITSSDFMNVSFLLDNNSCSGDSEQPQQSNYQQRKDSSASSAAAAAQLNGYNFESVLNDRTFLEKITNEDLSKMNVYDEDSTNGSSATVTLNTTQILNITHPTITTTATTTTNNRTTDEATTPNRTNNITFCDSLNKKYERLRLDSFEIDDNAGTAPRMSDTFLQPRNVAADDQGKLFNHKSNNNSVAINNETMPMINSDTIENIYYDGDEQQQIASETFESKPIERNLQNETFEFDNEGGLSDTFSCDIPAAAAAANRTKPVVVCDRTIDLSKCVGNRSRIVSQVSTEQCERESTPVRRKSTFKLNTTINLSPIVVDQIGTNEQNNSNQTNIIETNKTYDDLSSPSPTPTPSSSSPPPPPVPHQLTTQTSSSSSSSSSAQQYTPTSSELPYAPRPPFNHNFSFDEDFLNQQAITEEAARQSLTNFEEFEKSMLDNEKDFDDILNDFVNKSVTSMKPNKMRESLDHIKRRHQLINYETQHEQEMKKRDSQVLNDIILDSNKFNDSVISNKSSVMSSSSSSGERLLRRSRLYDDISPLSTSQNIQDALCKEDQSDLNDFNIEKNAENDYNNIEHMASAGSTENFYENHHNSTRDVEYVDKTNRDRFKTIRLSKRHPPSSTYIPGAEHTIDAEPSMHTNVERSLTFAKKDTNSPKILSLASNKFRTTEMSTNGPQQLNTTEVQQKPTSRMSQLQRPKQRTTGIAQMDFALKSSSVDSLAARKNTDTFKMVQPKSAMGNKAKSIHNLLDNAGGGGGYGMNNRTKLQSDKYSHPTSKLAYNVDKNAAATFKVPQPVAAGSTQQQQPPVVKRASAIKRTGLIRPSSGFYSYNVKRNDSDTESGRFSPTNSLSSASSKGSISKPDEEYGHSSNNGGLGGSRNSLKSSLRPNIMTTTQILSSAPAAPLSSSSSTSSLPPSSSTTTTTTNSRLKRSGIPPPTQIKKSGLPRPMSMANR